MKNVQLRHLHISDEQCISAIDNGKLLSAISWWNEILADKQSQQNKAELLESAGRCHCARLFRLLHLDRAQPSCQDVVWAVKNYRYAHACMCYRLWTILTFVQNLQYLVHIRLLPDFHIGRRWWWSYRQRGGCTDDRGRVCFSAFVLKRPVRFQPCLRWQKLDIQSAKSENLQPYLWLQMWVILGRHGNIFTRVCGN